MSAGILKRWLNQLELWFAEIERGLLARGIFTSMPDPARKTGRYIKRYNEPETDAPGRPQSGPSNRLIHRMRSTTSRSHSKKSWKSNDRESFSATGWCMASPR